MASATVVSEQTTMASKQPTAEGWCNGDDETAPLLDTNTPTVCGELYTADQTSGNSSLQTIHVYGVRWYVLGLFSLFSLAQSLIWNCFGPISQSAKLVFDWTDGTIGMFPNAANIASIIFMVPIAYLMDVKGLRVSVLGCCFLMAVGTGLQCITSQPTAATWLIMIAQILNGISGTVACAGPPLVSATWFPSNQRATSTAISSIFSYLGMAISFLVGPLLVPPPTDIKTNNVTEVFSTFVPTNEKRYWPIVNITEALDIKTQRDAIMKVMYYECGFACLLLVLLCVYFPAKPVTPPSITASIGRTDYVTGLRKIVKHGQFWLVALAYSIPVGLYSGWSAVLDINLSSINISQDEAGWLGFYSTVGGCLAGVTISRVADIFLRRLKLFLLVLLVLASGSVAWFTCLCFSYLPFNTGKTWMNWFLLGATVVAIPLLLVFKETYARTDIDLSQPTSKRVTVPQPDEREENLYSHTNNGRDVERLMQPIA
ncbi:solute carrier family 49 member 4-like isoform X2 [Gigantopelta aegis]|uniref:solute carrier family 49 member 4-like isoform X2 n=1 Tax=Gigantopelta aegis TaxID=1735272 RepID=UPI001B88B518|nr:solute carrier family 49 member 4-like isoform X2 [Gigantopelta aegis]